MSSGTTAHTTVNNPQTGLAYHGRVDRSWWHVVVSIFLEPLAASKIQNMPAGETMSIENTKFNPSVHQVCSDDHSGTTAHTRRQ